MKKSLLPLLLAVLACFPACRKEADLPAPGEQAVQLPEDGWLPGVAAVRFSEELLSLIGPELGSGRLPTRSEALQTLSGQLGIKSFRRVFEDDERFLERQHREGLHRWYYVSFDPESMPCTKAAGMLSDTEGIECAAAVPRIRPAAVVNDPYYSYQWHLHSAMDIRVEEVWAEYTYGDPKVTVAVIDSGVELSHEDLQENILPGGAGMSRNFINKNYAVTPRGHGTHVTGIIAATTNNGLGVAGIAGGNAAQGQPGVRVMVCQVIPEDESDSEGNAPDAFRYAADNGAVIAQNSWGYVLDLDGDGNISADELERAKSLSENTDPALAAAIDYFIKYAGCDNAGNQLPDSPMKGGLVVFAAGNDNIQYGAPADYEPVLAVASVEQGGYKSAFSNYGDWVDICAPGGRIASTYLTSVGDYVSASGTSQAAPMVSGVAALVLSYCGGPGFTNEMLRDCLVGGADPGKVSNRNIGPFLDAYGAMQLAIGYAAPVENNRPPVITADSEVTGLVLTGIEKRTIRFEISDPDGHAFRVDYEGPTRGVSWKAVSVSEYTLTIDATQIAPGSYSAQIRAKDRYEAESVLSVEYQVLENFPPVAVDPLADLLLDPEGTAVLDLGRCFSDPDGDPLAYRVSVSNNVVSAVVQNGGLTLVPGTTGLSELTVAAEDPRGNSASQSFRVAVRPASEVLSVYPTQVRNVLYVGTGTQAEEVRVRIVSLDSGVLLIDKTVTASVFRPAEFSLSAARPGRYGVSVSFGGETCTKTIVKI